MEEELLNKQQENIPENLPENTSVKGQGLGAPSSPPSPPPPPSPAAPSASPPLSPPLSPAAPVPQPKVQEEPVLEEESVLLKKEPSKFKINMSSLAPIGGFLLNFIIPLICLVLSGGLIIAVFLPSYRELPSLEADLDQKRVLSSQLETKIAALTELVDFASVVKENSNIIDEALVSEPKIPELLFQVDQMSRESGMSVDQLSYSGSEVASVPYESVPPETVSDATSGEVSEVPEVAVAGRGDIAVALGTTGSFWDLVAFLKSAENASRIIIIEDFRYTQAAVDDGSAETRNEVSATFRLLSPYLSVNSMATTDEPIELSISSAEFQAGMQRIKDLKHYDVTVPEDFVPVAVPVVVPEEETAEGEGTSPAEVPVTSPETGEVPAEESPADLTTTPETDGEVESPL